MFKYAVFGSLFVVCFCLVAKKAKEYGIGKLSSTVFTGNPLFVDFCDG